MSKILIVGNPTNEMRPFTSKEESDTTTIRLETTTMVSTNGYINEQKRVAFVRMPNAVVSAFAKFAGVPQLAKNAPIEEPVATTLKGVLQVQESFDPFYEGQSPKINPSSGEIIEKDGKEIFRNTVFLSDENAAEYLFGSVVVSDTGKYVFSSTAPIAAAVEEPVIQA